MKKVEMIYVLLCLICLPFVLADDDPTITPRPTSTPRPTPAAGLDPNSLQYWGYYDQVFYDDYYTSYNPITVCTQTPLPSSDHLMSKDGFLLKRGLNEELVLFRGAGQYDEITIDDSFFDNSNWTRVFDVLKDNNINLVRLFIRSGFVGESDPYFKFYPFTYEYDDELQRHLYSMHKYNDELYNSSGYFSRLNDFISAAAQKDIVILLSLFDFSWDVTGSQWLIAAWNPDNNDHGMLTPTPLCPSTPTPPPTEPSPSPGTPTPEPYHYYDQNDYFHDIFMTSGVPSSGLNTFGLTQRDYVLKVVAETRQHWNVIYEIGNEPKTQDQELLRNWVAEVVYWIRDGAGYGYPGAPDAIIGFAQGSPAVTDYIMKYVEGIDMIEMHNVYHGFEPGEAPDHTLTCAERIRWGLTLENQSIALVNDAVHAESTAAVGYAGDDKTRIRLADTDGLHRGNIFGDGGAWARDIDENCRDWAAMSHIHGAHFVTKEALWHQHPPTPGATPEVDCTTDGSNQTCGDASDGSLRTLGSYNHNCDDEYRESISAAATPGAANKFNSFDSNLGENLGELDIHQPYIRSAGWGYRIPQEDSVIDVYITNGNFMGNATGSELESDAWILPLDLLEDPIDLAEIELNIQSVEFSYVTLNTFHGSVTLEDPSDYFVVGRSQDPTPIIVDSTPMPNYSDIWPLVSIHACPITTPTATPTGTNEFSLDMFSSLLVDFNPPDVPEHLIRRWAIEENLSSNRDGEKQVICQAGFGYTRWYGCNNATGIFEIDVLLYDPLPATPAGSDLVLEASVDNVSWTPLASSSALVPVSVPEYYQTPTASGQFFRFKASADINSNLEADRQYALLLRLDKNSVESDVWPFLTVHPRVLQSIVYVDPAGDDDRADGSVEHPFETIQAAITYGKNNYDAGELEPIQIFLEPGTYTTKYKNEIILPESFQIKGSGINSSFIQLDPTAQENGQYLVAGHHSVISDCTIKCGSLVEHSDVVFRNCKFDVDPKMFQGNSFQAIDVQGWHDVSINNCIFYGCSCQNIVKAGVDSYVKMFDCDILSCSNGISFTENSLGFISNSIFQSTTGTCIAASGESEVTVEYSCFYNNTTNMNSTGGSVIQSGNLLYSNPLIVNAASGDYHLQQPTIQDNGIGASPCIDAGRYAVPGTRASTCIDGARDIDQFDIGFHYAFEDYRYSVPRYKTGTDDFGTWTTEVTIQNPNDYPVLMVMTWYDAGGTNSTEGDEITIDPHGYYIETITSVNAPYTVGSIEVETDGPVFGQIRSESYSVSTGRNSHTTQMQREWSLGDELSAANLCTGTWNAEVGGGTNDVWTEIILKNFNDEEVSFTGKFYHNNGQHASGQDISADPLDPHESRSIVKAPGFPVTWGNFEVQGASLPIVGEVIIHSEQQNSPNHNLSEAFILVPEPEYSSSLVEPCFLLADFGSTIWQQWIMLKNPTTGSVNATISLYHSDGTAFNPQPYPSPVAVNSKSNIALSSYNLLGTGEMASVLINSASNLMAYSEMVCYVPSSNDLVIGGSELDSAGEAHTRYFMPSARNVNSQGYPSEESWITIRNLTSQSNCFTVRIYDDTGTLIDEESDSLDGSALMMIGFRSGCDVFVDPGSNERFSVEIESESPISGWTENFWAMTNASDHWYDANMLQKW